MIALAVKDYDDKNIVEDCETGWRRFCCESLARTFFQCRELAARHRRLGYAQMQPQNRKDWETLRRQVSAWRWVFCGTGGEFTLSQTCRDLGLDATLIRRKVLAECRPERDINLLVEWVASQKERGYGKSRRENPATGGVGTSIVDSVRDFKRQHGQRTGRRGAQSHAVCRTKDRHAYRR